MARHVDQSVTRLVQFLSVRQQRLSLCTCGIYIDGHPLGAMTDKGLQCDQVGMIGRQDIVGNARTAGVDAALQRDDFPAVRVVDRVAGDPLHIQLFTVLAVTFGAGLAAGSERGVEQGGAFFHGKQTGVGEVVVLHGAGFIFDKCITR